MQKMTFEVMTCKREQIHVLNYHVSYYEDNENQILYHKLFIYEIYYLK